MKVAYFDCFSGASGDMIIGSMLDAGLSIARMRETLKKLKLPSLHISGKKVLKAGIAATQFSVRLEHGKKSYSTLRELLAILDRSDLGAEIKQRSGEILKRIASVEGQIHGMAAEDVHFHELGGLDTIVDVVGAVWGIRAMGIEKVYVSAINVGTGFIRCEHGTLPVPAPATLSLMKGKPIYSSGIDKELLTPTGAALLTALGSDFGTLPRMRLEQVGYGAGKSDLPHPNLLRLMIGSEETMLEAERVAIVETNIDDMNPQFYEYLMDKLLKLGVRDVFLTPIVMKKSRPATLLTLICPFEKLPAVAQFLFKETTTIGLRWREEARACADRETVSLRTNLGMMSFKVARWYGRVVNVSPEYEDCKRLAEKKGLALKTVFEEAKKEALTFLKDRGSG